MRGKRSLRRRGPASVILLVFAAIGLLGLLAACGAEEAEKEGAATPTPTTAAVPGAVVAEATATPTAIPAASDIAAGVRATPTPTPAGEKPIYGGIINIVSCCSGTVSRGHDPYHLSASGGDFTTMDSLVTMVYPYDPSKGVEYEGKLATEWSQRADGAWVFKLREGVTWHDGEKFTADDVVATMSRLLDEEVEVNSTRAQARQVFTSAEKVDDYTVILHTGGTPNTTAWSFLSNYTLTMVPAHLVIGDPNSTDWELRWLFMGPETTDTLTVGTGPFILQFQDSETEQVALRNPNYYMFDKFGQRLPYLDGFQRASVPDTTRRLARFAAGTMDYTIGRGAGLHPDRARELCSNTRDSECYVMEFPHGYFNTILNHTNTEPFKDERVRAATRYVQDMDEIAQLAYGGRQGYMVMDRGRFPGTALTVEEQAELIPWSVPERREEFVQKAHDLMTEAGYPDGFTTPFPYFPGGLCGGSFLDQYSRQVDAFVGLGIDTFLECREGVINRDEIRAGRFSVQAPGGSTRFIDPADGLLKFHLFDSSMAYGPWRYEGQQEVDDAYRVAQKATDESLRNEMFRDIERFIADPKWSVYPNMHTVVHVAVHGCVRNYHPGGTWGSYLWSHWRTWLEPDSKCREANSPYLDSIGYEVNPQGSGL